jgi:hypothetical protein
MASAYLERETLIARMEAVLREDHATVDYADAAYLVLHFAGFSDEQIDAHGEEARYRARYARDFLKLARAL